MVLILVRTSHFLLKHCPVNHTVRRIVFQSYSQTCSIRHLSTVTYQNNHPLNIARNKFNDLVVWYEQFTGMDEVRLAQNRVLQAEERFIKAQDKRRDVVLALSEIQSKLKEVYAELDTTTRGEDRYIHLVTKEHRLLKEERAIQERFSMAEREEREYFAALSSSVKESHEKERAQAERTKYWSIIGSIIGTVIGIIGTSINNQFKMQELKKLIKESANTDILNNLKSHIDSSNEKLDSYFSKANSNNSSVHMIDSNVEELLIKLTTKVASVENSVKTMEHNKNYQVVSTAEDPAMFVLPFQTLNESVQNEHKTTRVLLVTGLAALALIYAKFS